MSGDLHCHTKLSDGSLGIEDLIILAKKLELKTISITDHDCLAGTVRAKIIGARHGVNVIPGVEISCTDLKRGISFSIISYLSNCPERLEGICSKNLTARKKASQFMMLKAAQTYPITPDLVVKCATGATCLYINHIMHALMETGCCGSVKSELYEALFSKNSPQSVLIEAKYPEPSEVIDVIHEAEGVAIAVLPGNEIDEELINDLIAVGIDGIEVYNPKYSQEQTEQLFDITKKTKILATGGSNFHGMYSSGVQLGSVVTPDQQLSALMSYREKQRKLQKKAEMS